MVFVDYLSNPFANLSNIATEIIAATSNVIQVNSLIVCNRGAQDIRFNLQKVRVAAIPTQIFYVNEFIIKGYNSIDVLKELGLNIFLEYSVIPSVSDSLVCFSGGYSQKFDCEVTYTRLNETPI